MPVPSLALIAAFGLQTASPDHVCTLELETPEGRADRISMFVDGEYRRIGALLRLESADFTAAWALDAGGKPGAARMFLSEFILPANVAFPVKITVTIDGTARWTETAANLPRYNYMGGEYPIEGVKLPVRHIRLDETGDIFGARTLGFVAVDAAGIRTERNIAMRDWSALRRKMSAAMPRLEALRTARDCQPAVITHG